MNSKASRASGDYSPWIQGSADNRSRSRFGAYWSSFRVVGAALWRRALRWYPWIP